MKFSLGFYHAQDVSLFIGALIMISVSFRGNWFSFEVAYGVNVWLNIFLYPTFVLEFRLYKYISPKRLANSNMEKYPPSREEGARVKNWKKHAI